MPSFKVVQAQVKRYVLVLDISGSMGQPITRIQSLGRVCIHDEVYARGGGGATPVLTYPAVCVGGLKMYPF